jgi:hypothetical protein
MGEVMKIKKEQLDELIKQFPVGAVIEDYKQASAGRFGHDILGDNVQIVGICVTVRGDNAQMDVAFKHPNYMEDEDEDDSNDEQDENL